MSPLIEAKGVDKWFRSPSGGVVKAVNNVSMSIAAGETVGLIGESGSGKSTLGRLMLGLLTPDRGEIIIEGESLASRSATELRRLRAKMQVVFQEPYESLNPRLKVSTNIAEPLIAQGAISRAEREERVADALDHVGLPQTFGRRYPRELSGGQQQRVGIARAIVGRPRFVVLDEPTASLDRTIRRQISDLLMRLQQDLGLSYLLITHDIASVRRMAARSLVIFRGHVVESGLTLDILSSPGHPYTRALVSAELVARPAKTTERYRLKPRPTVAARESAGCPLVPICPLAIEECSVSVPPLLDMGGTHRAACIRWKDLADTEGSGRNAPEELNPPVSQEAMPTRRASVDRGGPLNDLSTFFVRRLPLMLVSLWSVITVAFLLVTLVPADPARSIAGPYATNADIAAVAHRLGLDRPLWTQYINYWNELFHGSLGSSLYTSESVTSLIIQYLPSTVELIILSLVVAAVAGLALGSISAYFHGRWPDRLSSAVTGVLQSVPDFVVGVVLIYFFAFVANLAPGPEGQLSIISNPPPRVTGMTIVDSLISGQMSTFVDALTHAILPVMTLGLVIAALFARISRAALRESLEAEQTSFARACGLPEWQVLRYAFLSSRIPIMTYGAFVFGALFGGTAIVETIFAWNGLSQWAVQSMLRHDYPAIQGFVLVVGIITVSVYLVLDLAVGILDPRVRTVGRS